MNNTTFMTLLSHKINKSTITVKLPRSWPGITMHSELLAITPRIFNCRILRNLLQSIPVVHVHIVDRYYYKPIIRKPFKSNNFLVTRKFNTFEPTVISPTKRAWASSQIITYTLCFQIRVTWLGENKGLIPPPTRRKRLLLSTISIKPIPPVINSKRDDEIHHYFERRVFEPSHIDTLQIHYYIHMPNTLSNMRQDFTLLPSELKEEHRRTDSSI